MLFTLRLSNGLSASNYVLDERLAAAPVGRRCQLRSQAHSHFLVFFAGNISNDD